MTCNHTPGSDRLGAPVSEILVEAARLSRGRLDEERRRTEACLRDPENDNARLRGDALEDAFDRLDIPGELIRDGRGREVDDDHLDVALLGPEVAGDAQKDRHKNQDPNDDE